MESACESDEALQESAERAESDGDEAMRLMIASETRFDDIATASFVNPPLTTALQHTRQAGEVVVDSPIALIRGEPVARDVRPVKLMVRRSSQR